MRIDHHAYQRGTKVAGFGLLLQVVLGVTLLVFGLVSNDTAFWFGSTYVLIGVPVWLGLIVIFHQHKLERLEALEEDELASTRAAGSVFDRAIEETRVAARRLALMHKWLMPTLSVIIATLLAGMAWWLISYMNKVVALDVEFQRTAERGWAIAICLGIAAVSFIFSRFVAGMAKQAAWQNLRGGAAYMVGNALVTIAIAGGILFRFFEKEDVMLGVAAAIPILMGILTLEILINFVLNIYRPRIPGDVPRPAFDSKLLSFFAAPDNIVRSINDAINYQFGFDVTSSWGYQLILRSFIALVALGAVTLVLVSTMVVVEPHQQAVKLRWGKLFENRVYDSGVMWKWPWPIESTEVYDVTRVRTLYLTARVLDEEHVPEERRAFLWASDKPKTDKEIEPFIVGRSAATLTGSTQLPRFAPDSVDSDESVLVGEEDSATSDPLTEAVSDFYSLVDAEVILQYRIKDSNNGLLEFLQFVPDSLSRRQQLTDRERAIRAIALSEISKRLSQLSLDDVLRPGHANLANQLRTQVQQALDDHATGVDVVSVDFPMLQPSGSSSTKFEELDISVQARQQFTAIAERNVANNLTRIIGDHTLIDQVLDALEQYEQLVAEFGSESTEAIEQKQVVESIFAIGGGEAAQFIARAEAERWVELMTKRAQFNRVRSQIDAYASAPELFRQRAQMDVYNELLPFINKYIIAIDPSRLNIDIDLTEIPSPLEFFGTPDEDQ